MTTTPESGTVVAIHISPARGIPMRSVEAARIHEGHGIDGDRYRNSRHRHVSVQRIEDLERAAAELGSPIEPGATRRNITIEGLAVPTTPGDRLTIGDVELEVVRIAAPCRLLDDEIGDGARTALRRRAGSIMRALGSGAVRVGDAVSLPAVAT
ncbi:MAG: MOSC domain-containing protein [Actinomycetota bacterium]